MQKSHVKKYSIFQEIQKDKFLTKRYIILLLFTIRMQMDIRAPGFAHSQGLDSMSKHHLIGYSQELNSCR
jgi:hypothetical protein